MVLRGLFSSRLGAAFLSAATTSLFAILIAMFSADVMRIYSLSLFIGGPFVMGVISTALYGMSAPRTLGACMGVAFLGLLFMFIGFLAFAIEGVVCLVMAAPLWIAMTALGVAVAWMFHRRYWSKRTARGFQVIIPILLVSLPIWTGAERLARVPPPIIRVATSIEIDAPPEVVWQYIGAFDDIAPPTELLFRAGVAYPIRAELDGMEVGAQRRCVLSTGALVEKVTTLQPGRELAFDVTINPPSMRERNPFYDVHPPHLNGYLAAHRGQFVLTPLPGGRTRVTGTSWYSNDMAPQIYWRLWSDKIVLDVQGRVLNHIKRLSEQDAARTLAAASVAAHGQATDSRLGRVRQPGQ